MVRGCEREAKKRGWCLLHYERWRKFGAPTDEIDEAPSPQKVREHLAVGTCPFCGRGPFKVIAGHVFRAHGIDRYRLRDLGEIKWSESICSPEHAEIMRTLAIENDRVAAMAGKQVVGRTNPVSVAGRLAMAKAGETSGERRRVVPVSAYPAIVERATRGESARSIGVDYGVGSARIRQIVKATAR